MTILFIYSEEFNVCTDRKRKTKKKKGKGKVDKKGLSTLEKDFRFHRYKSAGQ